MSAQSLAALELANKVRLRHATVKRQIATGEATVAEILFTRRHEVESMTIGALLRAQDRWGPVRSGRITARMNIRDNKRVGDLTHRQVNVLVALLEG